MTDSSENRVSVGGEDFLNPALERSLREQRQSAVDISAGPAVLALAQNFNGAAAAAMGSGPSNIDDLVLPKITVQDVREMMLRTLTGEAMKENFADLLAPTHRVQTLVRNHPRLIPFAKEAIFSILTDLAEKKLDFQSIDLADLFSCARAFPGELYIKPLRKVLGTLLKGKEGLKLIQSRYMDDWGSGRAGMKALDASIEPKIAVDIDLQVWLRAIMELYPPLANEAYDCIVKLNPDARILYLGALPKAQYAVYGRLPLHITDEGFDSRLYPLFNEVFEGAKDEAEVRQRAHDLNNHPDWENVLNFLSGDGKAARVLIGAFLRADADFGKQGGDLARKFALEKSDAGDRGTGILDPIMEHIGLIKNKRKKRGT